MLPFDPQFLGELRERYPDAVRRAVTPSATFDPADHRRHVFDSDDGLRLVVYRSRAMKGGFPSIVHVSARLMPDTPIYRRWLMSEAMRVGFVNDSARARFADISGDGRYLEFVKIAFDAVSHLIIPPEDPDA